MKIYINNINLIMDFHKINKKLKTLKEEDICFYENLIYKYGSYQTIESIQIIEKKENIKLPECIKEFLLEKNCRPISALDYRSLYPSIIQNHNLSTEMIIKNNIQINNLNFNYVNYGCGECYSVDHMGGSMGVFPTILKTLGDDRIKIKKKLKEIVHKLKDKKIQKDKIKDLKYQYACYDSNQRALKVMMNTFYGEAGNSISPLYMPEIANTVTCIGRKYLMLVKKFLENKNYKIYYGDSVTGDTPIILFNSSNKQLFIKKIKNIVNNKYKWEFDLNTNKYIMKLENLMCWSYDGWTKINYIIKHYTKKKIYKVTTKMGIVNVTEDHSLLNEYANPLTVKDCIIGTTKLLHSFPTNTINKNYVDKYAYLWGFATRFSSQNKYNITFSHPNLELLKNIRKKIYLMMNTKESELEIKKYGGIYKMRSKKRIYCSVKLKRLFKIIKKNRVPNKILNANFNSIIKFMLGFIGKYDSINTDIHKSLYKKHLYFKDQIYCSQICLLLFFLKIKFFIHFDIKYNQYQIIIKNSNTKFPWTITNITQIYYKKDSKKIVYDLNTNNGSFNAGIGALCLHNTDSLYISPPNDIFQEIDKLFYSGKINKKDYWDKMVNLSIKNIKKEQIEVNKFLKKTSRYNFLKMVYEETLWPVLFITKKKYLGRIHENMAQLNTIDIFKRGLDSEKRGSCLFIKKMMQSIIENLLKVENLLTLHDIALNKINKFYQGKINIEVKDFVKTFRYNGTVKNIRFNNFAIRMQNENNIILKNGERYGFVMTKKYPFKFSSSGAKINLSGSDKMELFNEKITLNDIDYDYYIGILNNQIAKFILYKKVFNINIDTNLSYIKRETKLINNAIKYIHNKIKNHYITYDTGEGKIRKCIFKYLKKKLKIVIKNNFNPIIENILTTQITGKFSFYDHVIDKIKKKSLSITKKFGIYFINTMYPNFKIMNKNNKIKLIIQLQKQFYVHKGNNCIPKYELIHIKSDVNFRLGNEKLYKIYKELFIELENLYYDLVKIIKNTSDQIYKKINAAIYLDKNGALKKTIKYINFEELIEKELENKIQICINEININDNIQNIILKYKNRLKYKELFKNYMELFRNKHQIDSIIYYLKNFNELNKIKAPKKDILELNKNNIKKEMLKLNF